MGQEFPKTSTVRINQMREYLISMITVYSIYLGL